MNGAGFCCPFSRKLAGCRRESAAVGNESDREALELDVGVQFARSSASTSFFCSTGARETTSEGDPEADEDASDDADEPTDELQVPLGHGTVLVATHGPRFSYDSRPCIAC